MVEAGGGGGDICVWSSEEGGRFSGPLPFERAAAALAAMLFALAFRLATPPRAFFTGFSAEGFSLRNNSLSKYPIPLDPPKSKGITSSFLLHSFSILNLLFRIQILQTFLLNCNMNQFRNSNGSLLIRFSKRILCSSFRRSIRLQIMPTKP